MYGLTRRDLIGGAMSAAAAAGLGAAGMAAVKNASAEEAKDYVATENISQQGYVPDMRMSGMRAPDCTDHLLARVLEESEVKGDLTLPDGRVVPAVYVRLRNRLNRIGNGCGSECRPSSWDLYMYKLDEEQAEILCKVPMLAWFTAEDLEAVSDYTHEEAVQKLDEIAFGGMIAYQDRSGKRYYVLQPYIAGYWEATELIDYYKGGEDVMAAYDVLSQDGLGADYGFQLTANTFALNTVDPISLDVIAEDDFLPYMDWRKRILSNEIVGMAACQCRIMNKAIDGWEENGRFEMDRCIYLGASGEYFINIGAAKQVTPEEAVEICERSIAAGLVPQHVSCKESDIICFCHCTECIELQNYKSFEGTNPVAMKNYSAYTLEYDPEKCISCGACIDWCPMQAIKFGDDNKCVHADICVRCGQCITKCPADARILRARDDFPFDYYPTDYQVDRMRFFAKERMARGLIWDWTETEFPADYVDPFAPAEESAE